jgi:hypothetical protein
MKIHWKKELYSISIDDNDPLFKPLGMDNRSYCRINGQWHYNSGGTQLEWRKMDIKNSPYTNEQIKLIEDVFLETRAKQL